MIDGLIQKNIIQKVTEKGRSLNLPFFSNSKNMQCEILESNTASAWHLVEHPFKISVIQGKIKLVFFDNRNESISFGAISEVFCGSNVPQEFAVPNGILLGYQKSGDADCVFFYNAEALKMNALDIQTHFIPYHF